MDNLDEPFLLNAIDRIYSSALDPASWRDTLKVLSDKLDYVGGDLYIWKNEVIVMNVMGGLPQEASEEYIRDYHAISERHRAVSNMPEGIVVSDDSFVTYGEMKKSAYYEYTRRWGVEYSICGNIIKNETENCVFAIHRQKGYGPPDDEHLALFLRLAPHFKRAVQIQLQLTESQSKLNQLIEVINKMTTGVVLVDELGNIDAMNKSAGEIIAGYDGIELTKNRLLPRHTRERSKFEKMLANSLSQTLTSTDWGGMVSVTSPTRLLPISLFVAPMPKMNNELTTSKAIIFISDPMRSNMNNMEEILKLLYGLTPAESKLAVAIADGEALKVYAERNNLSYEYVRFSSKIIFQKTDTHSQTELIRLILKSIPPVILTN